MPELLSIIAVITGYILGRLHCVANEKISSKFKPKLPAQIISPQKEYEDKHVLDNINE